MVDNAVPGRLSTDFGVFSRLRLAAAVVIANHAGKIAHLLQDAEFPIWNVVQEYTRRHSIIAEKPTRLVEHGFRYPYQRVRGRVANDGLSVGGFMRHPEGIGCARPVPAQTQHQHQQRSENAAANLDPQRTLQ